MRVKVTTEIEGVLKLQYDAVQDRQKPTMRQLIEKGMLAYLVDKDPAQALTLRIHEGERSVQELREQLAALRVLEPQQKRLEEWERKEQVRRKRLEEWLSADLEGKIAKYERRALNYTRIAPRIGAKSAVQAEEWIRECIESWKAIHEQEAHS